MKICGIAPQLVTLSICVTLIGPLAGQTLSCGEIIPVVAMARAKSAHILIEEKRKVSEGYRSQVVFAARWFELHSTDRQAAVALLTVIPENDQQQEIWMTLGSNLCNGETISDMKVMAGLRDRLSRDLAAAVMLAEEKLQAYLDYAETSTQDPHSDYALQMEKVCRAKHREFLKAVDGLPSGRRDWFVGHILDPKKCRALALPEQ